MTEVITVDISTKTAGVIFRTSRHYHHSTQYHFYNMLRFGKLKMCKKELPIFKAHSQIQKTVTTNLPKLQ